MAAKPLEIVRVPVLADNYSWLLFDPETHEAGVVDPPRMPPRRAPVLVSLTSGSSVVTRAT